MSNLPQRHSEPDKPNRFYGYLVLASVLLALTTTFWDSLDLQLARFFISPAAAGASAWWWVQLLNDYTPTYFRGLVLVSVLLWLIACLQVHWKRWRLPFSHWPALPDRVLQSTVSLSQYGSVHDPRRYRSSVAHSSFPGSVRLPKNAARIVHL